MLCFSADIAVVDMSDVFRQPSLFYHLGVRESFDMANNVILYHDTDPDTAQSLKVHTHTHTPYNLNHSLQQSYVYVTEKEEIVKIFLLPFLQDMVAQKNTASFWVFFLYVCILLMFLY